MMNKIIRCTRCVMDNNTDPDIYFYRNGTCNYCTDALKHMSEMYYPNEHGELKIQEMVKQLKNQNFGSKYDCIMGISGGLDSSYLLYLGKQWELIILCVHVDDGFNTNTANENVAKLLKATDYDCISVKPCFPQYNALLKAYLKASVPTVTIPQDNVLFAELYSIIQREGISYFLSGGNFAQESINTKSYGTLMGADLINIQSIHGAHGTEPIDKLSFFSTDEYNRFKELGIETITPLNYINYNKKDALITLSKFCDYQYYEGKHLENIWTAFMHTVWLPQKFGLDLRTNYLSSLIISGQIDRDEALLILKQPYCDAEKLAMYISVIKNRLNITDVEFDDIMSAPVRQHTDFENSEEYKRNLFTIPTSINVDTKVIIFGAGNWGEYAYKILEGRCSIIGFYDNNDEKHFTEFFSRKILPPPGHLMHRDCQENLVVIACKDSDSVITQLNKSGYGRGIYKFDYDESLIYKV